MIEQNTGDVLELFIMFAASIFDSSVAEVKGSGAGNK